MPVSFLDLRVPELCLWRDERRGSGRHELLVQHLLHLHVRADGPCVVPLGQQPAMRRPDAELMLIVDDDPELIVFGIAHGAEGYRPPAEATREELARPAC